VKHYLLPILVLVLFSTHIASAESVTVNTNKDTYNYGDHLSVTISVSNVSSDLATMYIIGPDNNKSSAIPVKIAGLITTINSPSSFDPSIYKEGTYTIEVEYGGERAKVSFDLVDAGNKFMPFGSTSVVAQWISGGLADHSLITYLTDKDLIVFSGTIDDTVSIPSWYKGNGVWWLDQKITDVEFLNGLQYLVDSGVVS
jgi:hypothetical protein